MWGRLALNKDGQHPVGWGPNRTGVQQKGKLWLFSAEPVLDITLQFFGLWTRMPARVAFRGSQVLDLTGSEAPSFLTEPATTEFSLVLQLADGYYQTF